MSFIHNCLT